MNPAPEAKGPRRINPVLATVLICAALTILFGSSYYWNAVMCGSRPPTVFKALWWHSMEWFTWGALTPVIFWACRRFQAWPRAATKAAGYFTLGVVCVCIHAAVVTLGAQIEALVYHTGSTWMPLWRLIVVTHTVAEIVAFLAIVTGWYLIDYYRKYRERDLRAAHLASELESAQLNALKMQLNPHFLFNTLNGIAALNCDDPPRANQMLEKLAELLRSTLAGVDRQFTTVAQEFEYNRRYLELEQMRFGERLAMHLELDRTAVDAEIPTLLLQPLVENAVRHGVAPHAAPGSVTLRASARDGQLRLSVEDTGRGSEASVLPPAGHGIGLSNTRKRLQHLYGREGRLWIGRAPAGGTLVTIEIPLRRHAAAPERHDYSYADR
jgi:two-component system LytT family sensor kinase